MKVPENWNREPTTKTRSELLQRRKEMEKADLSYDLDGDGVVDGKDYYISKRFDLDRDGKLNETERKNAEAALKSGFEQQYVWGCDTSGVLRSFRILQKRGIPIIDDDFGKVIETYPFKQPNPPQIRHSVSPKPQKAPQKTEKSSRVYHFQTNKIPTGLYNREIPLTYAEKPRYKSYSEMKEHKRKELVLLIQKESMKINVNHKNEHQRLEERLLQSIQPPSNGRTATNIKKKRRRDDINELSNTFGRQTKGVHVQELPKFSSHLKEYWKKDHEIEQSRTRLIENRKLGGKPEAFILSDHDNSFVFDYKTQREIRRKSVGITEKPNHVWHKDVVCEKVSPVNSSFTDFYRRYMLKHKKQSASPVLNVRKKFEVCFTQRNNQKSVARSLFHSNNSGDKYIRTKGFAN